jgi:hypothetical protein
VKNGAKSVPFKTIRTLADGSELVLLRESAGMLGKRRRQAQERYSKPHVIEKKNSPRAASNASP